MDIIITIISLIPPQNKVTHMSQFWRNVAYERQGLMSCTWFQNRSMCYLRLMKKHFLFKSRARFCIFMLFLRSSLYFIISLYVYGKVVYNFVSNIKYIFLGFRTSIEKNRILTGLIDFIQSFIKNGLMVIFNLTLNFFILK